MSKEKTFEEELKELEATMEALRDPDLTLDESMNLYKKGMKLSKFCAEELSKAEGTLKKLTENLTEEDFEINEQ